MWVLVLTRLEAYHPLKRGWSELHTSELYFPDCYVISVEETTRANFLIYHFQDHKGSYSQTTWDLTVRRQFIG